MKYLKPSYKGINAKTLTSFIASAYMLMLFVIYPFYMKEGYVNISDHKFTFFLYSSIGAVLLLLLTGFTELIKSMNSFRSTDAFMLLFILVAVVSYLLSDYKDTAILGTGGWYLGLVFLVLISVLYLLISRLWEFEVYVLYAALIASFFVFILGIFDRFSIYLIPLEIRTPSFISTLGNINWFMGYSSVLMPLGAGLFLSEINASENRLTLRGGLLGVYTLVAFCAGFAQGSESVFLVFFVIFNAYLFLLYKQAISGYSVGILLIIWGIASQLIRLFRVLYPIGYNYNTDGPCAYMTSHSVGVYFAVVGLLFCTIKSDNSKAIMKTIAKIIFLIEAVLIAGIIVIGMLKTKAEMFSGINSSLFYFDERFGSFRGVAYGVSIDILKRFSPLQWIFGIGPDCFSKIAYSYKDLSARLMNVWPNDTLTNAHSELLTMLINQGIMGLITYLGIFITFLKSSLKRYTNPILWCISLSVMCYMVHNLISFMQVLSTPYIFILMAIASVYTVENP